MSEHNRRNLRIGLAPENGTVATEQFAGCQQLSMYFEANHRFVTSFQFFKAFSRQKYQKSGYGWGRLRLKGSDYL
jgi:hypothetical protein